MNSITKSTSPDVYNYLKKHGCCDTCCVRYYNGRCDDYLNADKFFETRGITVTINDSEVPTKRAKGNPCIACLGIFDSSVLDTVLENIVKYPQIDDYKCETVLTSVSLPISLSLRQLSIWIGLIKEFPERFSLEKPPDVPLKEVVKQVLNPKVCQRLNKTFELNQNGLMINVFFVHPDETDELKFLEKVNPKVMNERLSAPRKFKREFITRNAFEKHFNPSKIDRNLFAKYIPVPGDVCLKPIEFDKITVQGPTVFVAGRYRKLSRQLSQSPWILQGKRMMEESVQEVIMRQVVPYFNCNATDTAIFSSSGREDVDVRCLGRGRPFVIEIPDAKMTYLPKEIAAQMQLEIDKSEKVSINYLQIVKREELSHIKSGEEFKRKCYRALCILKEPATIETMTKLNISNEFIIHQTTPLRVLHRRALSIRDRAVYSVKAYLNKDNHCQVILDITTQAGTYVKELIHGEFGRTNPSISSIIGQWIDIAELDVIDIELDWPPPTD